MTPPDRTYVVGLAPLMNQYRNVLVRDDDTNLDPVNLADAPVLIEPVGVLGRRAAVHHHFSEPQLRRLRKLLIADGNWSALGVTPILITFMDELPADWRFPVKIS